MYFSILEDANALPQSSFRRQSWNLSCAFCGEMALLSYVAGHLFGAIVLGAVSSAGLSWSRATTEVSDPGIARQVALRTSLGLALVLATAITLGPYLRGVHFFRGAPGASTTANAGSDRSRQARPTAEQPGDSATGARDAYSGIVLWPKKQQVTKLIAPQPMSWEQQSPVKESNPLVIPFDGVYWFYRSPDLQPPPTSREAQGSPDKYEIHSTDWRPLHMEAHQNLGELIPLSCCSRIEVEIRNEDRFPDSVTVELVLVDNSAPGKPSESLGQQTVSSTPHHVLYQDRPPSTETLKFHLPGSGPLKRFDELAIVFRLEGYRAREGAKIGIDHLTLVPRGM